MAAPKIPPGPRGRLLTGHTLDYMRDPLGYLTRIAREHGDVVRLRLGNTGVYALNHPELIAYVLRDHPENFIKDTITRLIIPVVGNGLLTSEGSFWRRQRKLAQPAFQHQQVRRYGEVMVEQAERMVDGWGDGQPHQIDESMMLLTLGIVAKTFFDAELSGEARDVGRSLDVLMNYYLSPMKWLRVREYLPIPSTIRFRRAIANLDRIIYGFIRRRRESGHDPGDLLSRLLAAQDDAGAGMTDRQLRDEAVTIFLAGHETTALALTYAFDLLARHPEAGAKLAAELDEVLGDRPPTADDIPNLPYTGCVVREAMRIHPPAWGIGREALADCEIGGYHVPKGTQLVISQWVVHRDPRWWDDPEAFRPERWEDDLVKRLPRCTYFPFGDGPRICIGVHFAMMEAMLILATIARRFRLSLATDRPLEFTASVTLRPKHRIRMVSHARRATVAPR